MRQDARRQPKKRERKKPALKRDTMGLIYADRCGQKLSEGH